jgi:hypothetical protein
MGSNAVIDIAIALVLMYLLLSLFVTVINEYIATLLKLRATTLRNGVKQILDDPALRGAFYGHGVVAAKNKAVGGQDLAVGGQDLHISYMSGQTFALALLGVLAPNNPVPGFDDIKTAVANLPASNIRDTLLSQITLAGDSLEKLRDGLARSFDATMDRVSGVYKRYLKWISLAVGFVVAGALNADTIAVGTALWNDASLRAEMAQTAAMIATRVPNGGSAEDAATLSDVAEKVKQTEGIFRPLPVGWSAQSTPKSLPSWAAKACGLILTGLALSLGAPFWFDLLGKFMNLRGAGPKPLRTPEQRPDQRPVLQVQTGTALGGGS